LSFVKKCIKRTYLAVREPVGNKIVGFNDFYAYVVTKGSSILTTSISIVKSIGSYFYENLACLTYGFEAAALQISKFLAYHSLLAEVAELFGVLIVVTVLLVISFTLITVIVETSVLLNLSNRFNLKLRTDLLKTTFFKKHAEFKSYLKNFF
jgi:hypothetical protein